jgi:hypothetical protein
MHRLRKWWLALWPTLIGPVYLVVNGYWGLFFLSVVAIAIIVLVIITRTRKRENEFFLNGKSRKSHCSDCRDFLIQILINVRNVVVTGKAAFSATQGKWTSPPGDHA